MIDIDEKYLPTRSAQKYTLTEQIEEGKKILYRYQIEAIVAGATGDQNVIREAEANVPVLIKKIEATQALLEALPKD